MTAEEIIKAVSGLPSYILDDDIRLYHETISPLPVGSRVLELGTGWGKSAAAMALCNPDVTIYTIDNGHDPLTHNNRFKDIEDYKAQLLNIFDSLKIKNIDLIIGDLETLPVPVEEFDVLHVDLSVDTEVPMTRRWITSLNRGGVFLNRNYDRHYPEFDQIVLDRVFIKKWGQIRAVQL